MTFQLAPWRATGVVAAGAELSRRLPQQPGAGVFHGREELH